MQEFGSTLVNAPYLNLDGLNVTWASATTLTIGTGQCRDSTNFYDISSPSVLTLNTALSGVNGLDAGTLAINTWYAVFIIFDPTNANPPACLMSTSGTAPVMPSKHGVTYGAFRRVGWTRTDGSSNLLSFVQTGAHNEKSYQWLNSASVLSAGSSATFASVSCAAGAPPQTGIIQFQANYTPVTAASVASIRSTGFASTALSCPIELKGAVDAVAYKLPSLQIVAVLTAGVPSIQYQVTASDALTLLVTGFKDSL